MEWTPNVESYFEKFDFLLFLTNKPLNQLESVQRGARFLENLEQKFYKEGTYRLKFFYRARTFLGFHSTCNKLAIMHSHKWNKTLQFGTKRTLASNFGTFSTPKTEQSLLNSEQNFLGLRICIKIRNKKLHIDF